MPTYILGLDIVPAHIHLAQAAEQVYTRVFREAILANALKGVDYDFVLIDCPPSLGVLTTNSLYACDFIIIPCQISRYSLDGLADLLTTVETVKNVSMEDLFQEDMFRILLTMFDKRNSITNEYILGQLKPYRDKTFTTIIMKNEALNQAQIAQKAIFDYEPRCPGSVDYSQLCLEFLEIWRKRNSLPAKRPSCKAASNPGSHQPGRGGGGFVDASAPVIISFSSGASTWDEVSAGRGGPRGSFPLCAPGTG